MISDMECGGAQQVVSKLLDGMLTKNFNLGLVTLSDPVSDFFQVNHMIERYSLRLVNETSGIIGKFGSNLMRIYRIREAMKAFKPDIVVSFIAPTNCLTILASAGLNVRIIISERNDPRMQSFGRTWDQLRRALYRFADIVTANSQGAIKGLSDYVTIEKLTYLPNLTRYSVDSEHVNSDIERHHYFLSVARLHWQKNHEVTIKAFSKVAHTLPGWKLVFVGAGETMHHLKDLVWKLNLKDRIVFEGQLDDPAEHYRKAGLFIMVSKFEGQPNTLLEAMVFGLPVIASSAIPDIKSLVVEPQSGLECPVDDVQALADAMLKLAKDDNLRRKFGVNGRRFMENYGEKEILERWLKCITQPTHLRDSKSGRAMR